MGRVSSWVSWVKCHRAFVGIYWSKIVSRGSFVGSKFFSRVFRGSKIFSRGYFMGPKFLFLNFFFLYGHFARPAAKTPWA